MYPVLLSGRTVILREFGLVDVDAAFRIVGDGRVTSSLSFDTRDRAQARSMVEGIINRAQQQERNEYYLAADANQELVGFARLELAGARAAKLGCAVRFDRWGHGYATDATRAIIAFGFHRLQLHRISAAIGPANTASIALIKRLGFTYEGRIRDHVYTNNQWRDSLLYSMLAEEWEAQGRSSAR